MPDSLSEMATVHLVHVFTLTVISLLSTPTSCKLTESIVSTRENCVLKGHLLQRLRIANSLSCAHRCLRKERCRSFNFKLLSKSQGLCELSSKAAGYLDDGLTEEEGWYYGHIASIIKRFSADSDVPGKYKLISCFNCQLETVEETYGV